MHKLIVNLSCRIVPNLAISKILSRENNKVRILQVKTSFPVLVIIHTW